MEIALIILALTFISNMIISLIRKDKWQKWILLSIILGPLGLAIQIFDPEF